MELFMKKNVFSLFILFAFFATSVAKEVSYYPSVIAESECYPASSRDVFAGFEKKIARFHVDVIENVKSILYCLKTQPHLNANTSVCVCRLYNLESTLSTDKYFDNIWESSVENSVSPSTGGYFSQLGTVIWIVFYIQILFYAYYTITKYRSDGLTSTKHLHQNGSSSDQWSELDLGEGLGTLYASPILPSNFNPSPSNKELEERTKNEYVFIRRPFRSHKVEEWLKDQTNFTSKSNVFDSRKSGYKKEKSSDPQCGHSGFLINHQRSEIFLEGIPEYNNKPARCWGSMHNIGENIDTTCKAWCHSLPNICAKWNFKNEPGWCLLPDPLIEKEKGVFGWHESSSVLESMVDNMDSISVAYLRRFYQRYQRRKKRAKAYGMALSSSTSSESESSDSCGLKCCLSQTLSSLSNTSTLLNMVTTFEETTQNALLESLPQTHPDEVCGQPKGEEASHDNPDGMWTLYRYPIPPSITSSSPHHDKEIQANKEYIFIQRPYHFPLVDKWLQDTTGVSSNENGSSGGYSSYLINSDRTEIIMQGVPGYRHEVKPKCWSSMHQIGEHNKRFQRRHDSLPNIFSELRFKYKSNFNEHTFKSFVATTNERCPDEIQSNYPQVYEDNLYSISVANDNREIQIDKTSHLAARAEVEENGAIQLAVRQEIIEPCPKVISKILLDKIKQEFHHQVMVPLVLNTSKVMVMEILGCF